MTDDLVDLTDPEPWSHEDIPLDIDAEHIYRHAIVIGGRRRRHRRQRYVVASAALALVVAFPIVARLASFSKQTHIGHTADKSSDTPDPSTLAALRAAAPGTDRDTDEVLAVGDSVMAGAANSLSGAVTEYGPKRTMRIFVDAKTNRRFQDTIAVLRAYKNNGALPPTIVVHIGMGGVFTDDQFKDLMAVIGKTRTVLFLNATAPHTSEAKVNSHLATAVRHYPNASISDWHDASASNDDWFARDEAHLTLAGTQGYANFIHQEVVNTLFGGCTSTVEAAKSASAVYYANTRRYPTKFTDLINAKPPYLAVAESVTVAGNTLRADRWTVTLSGGGAKATNFVCKLK